MRLLQIIVSSLSLMSYASAQLSNLNDEFSNSTTLPDWTNITGTDPGGGYAGEHFELIDVDNTNTGRLTLMPRTSAWFAEYRGGFLYKNVTGDFIFTTEVTARSRDDEDPALISTTYSLGGAFIRTPPSVADVAGNDHNYVFLSTGYADPTHPTCPGACPGPHLEVKNTTDGSSNLRVAEVANGPVVVRIARIGSAIICLYRPSGATDFIVHERYTRSDMPNDLQVGFVAYTDWPKVETYLPSFHNQNELELGIPMDPSSNPAQPFNPDLIAQFEYARFDDVAVPPALAGVDLVNTATDNQLLSFLGFDPNVALPIELLRFEGSLRGEAAVLEWEALSTAEPIFVVQHSRDGLEFQDMAITTGEKGRHNHSWQTPIDCGSNFFRLKTIDEDGTEEYSQVITLARGCDISIAPNPSSTTLNVTGVDDVARLYLYDVFGKRFELSFAHGQSTVDISHLPAGSYSIEIRALNGKLLEVKQFVKL